jgi:hypothetical protein
LSEIVEKVVSELVGCESMAATAAFKSLQAIKGEWSL